MKNIVLYAPPNAGKGTQCEFLVKNHGYKVISIGDVLRNARNPETEVGRIIIETQDKGILTPDNIVAEALKGELEKYQGQAIILDGYPRNIDQAKLLDTILTDYIVINLTIERDLAMKRCLGRVTCKDCKRIYNVYFEDMKPKMDGICDDCGGLLESRSDDNEASMNKRFDVYEENAPKILDFYKDKNILYQIDSSISKEYTNEEVEKILNEGMVND